MNPHNRRYAILVVLLAAAGTYWAGSALAVLEDLRFGNSHARIPLEFGFSINVISGLRPEALQAGLQLGDTLLEVGGKPFNGVGVLRDAVLSSRPGDQLTLRIQRTPDRAAAQISLRLAPERSGPASLSDWARRVLLQLAFPLFCLGLGFWVAFARPLDSNAWLLLGILISLEFLMPVGEWRGPGQVLRTFWGTVCGFSWPAWMMLFGIYFPERSRLDRNQPWIKWLLLAAIAVTGVAQLVFQIGREISFDSVSWLGPVLFPLDRVRTFVGMGAISLFFASLGMKSATASTRDARRRIGLVWIGASCGLTPLFLIAVFGLIRGGDIGSGLPEWVLYFALGCLAIFPITLAYVIVVQRAMEVRMVIRQSAQYALARGVLWVIRALIVCVAISIFVNLGQKEFHPATATFLFLFAALLLLFRQIFLNRATRWMDKRFFREAYSAEQVLSDLSSEARNFVEAKPLLETVTRRISETLHVPRISVLLREGEVFHIVPSLNGTAPSNTSLASDARAIQTLRATGKPAVVYFDDPNSWLRGAPEPERQMLKDIDAQLLLQLRGREELLGVMVLGPKRSEEPYSKTDLQLLQSVASQTGLTLENTRLIVSLAEEAARRERFSREMEIAREVQERLFPQSYPVIQGLNCAGYCRPALGVGGDYYDFIPLSEGRLGIAIGDISGKGISAALLMASLRASLRGQTLNATGDLAVLMRNVNSLLYEASTANRYATFFYAQYDPATRRLDFVNAGHNPPLILRGAETIQLEAGGTVVGLLPHTVYRQQSLILEPGDTLLAYTDGISEAMNKQDEEWGEDRMAASARSHIALPAADIITRMMADADLHISGAPQHDDMTIVIVKVLA